MQQIFLARFQKSVLLAGLILFASLFSAGKSFGEAAITVGDDVKIKFGVLFQGQIDESQTGLGDDQQNIFLRRARVLLGGQLAPNLTFFTEFDNPNLGKQAKNSPSTAADNKNVQITGFDTLDAVLTWKPVEPIYLDMGLILVPICRNCLQGAAMLLPISYANSSFVESSATGSDVGRDTGLQLRSYLLNDKLEIRWGAFQGYRQVLSSGNGTAGNPEVTTGPFRMTARIQYNVFDAEKGLFYTGTYLGKKKVLAVGLGYDEQGNYRAQAIDAFLDYPLSDTLAVTAQVDHLRWMPGPFCTGSAANCIVGGTAIPDTGDWVVEAGLYVSPLKLQPFIQYEDQQLWDGTKSDTRYFQGGIGYYFASYNGNLKLSGGYKDTGTVYTNEVTLQLQGFYF